MLQITLTQKNHPKPVRQMTRAELYEAGRASWVLGSAADRENYALIVFEDEVLQAVEIESFEHVPGVDGKPDRKAIHGKVLDTGHPVYDAFVGQPAPMPSTQNPIKYVSHRLDLTPCACGCGEPVRADFLPGHDQRAIHDRIGRIGSVRDFLVWFDKTYNA